MDSWDDEKEKERTFVRNVLIGCIILIIVAIAVVLFVF